MDWKRKKLQYRWWLIIRNWINGKGKGKEYLFNELIFEGEFSNGKRNGKGKQYWNNKLKFEGEFLNGELWNGNGVDYFYNEQFIFEGRYLNGKKWYGKIINGLF